MIDINGYKDVDILNIECDNCKIIFNNFNFYDLPSYLYSYSSYSFYFLINYYYL